MTSTRMARLARSVAGAAALVFAASALAGTPRSGAWAGKDTDPKNNQVSGTPTFIVTRGGRAMKKFTIPLVSKYCAYTGVSAAPVYVPAARIKRGRVNVKYSYGPKDFRASYKLTDRFVSATTFRGKIVGRTCVFDVVLIAHPK